MQSSKSLGEEADNVSLLLKKSMTLRELIDMSQESRSNPKSLPDSLFGKIKVKPIANKRKSLDHHVDLMADGLQRQSNAVLRNVVPPIGQNSGGLGENSKTFKQKLTDFIM